MKKSNINKYIKVFISLLLGLLVTYFVLSFFYFIITRNIFHLAISFSVLCTLTFTSIFYEIIKLS